MKKTYYTMVDGDHHISYKQHFSSLLEMLTVNMEFFIDDYQDDSISFDPGSKDTGYNIDPGVKSEFCDFSIIRGLNKVCRVKCYSGFIPGAYDLDISIIKFLTLKQELILKSIKMNPDIVAEDPDNFALTYSIEVDCKTVGESVEVANNFDKDITGKIIAIDIHALDLYRYAAGIISHAELSKILSTSGLKV